VEGNYRNYIYHQIKKEGKQIWLHFTRVWRGPNNAKLVHHITVGEKPKRGHGLIFAFNFFFSSYY
jgi:hypothetical protein